MKKWTKNPWRKAVHGQKGVRLWVIGNVQNAVMHFKEIHHLRNVHPVKKNANSWMSPVTFLIVGIPAPIQGWDDIDLNNRKVEWT